MRCLAIIPARSGSKGLKDKNIKCFCGKPLMAWTIIEAIKSKCFSKIIVSTDSDIYAEVAKKYGADVPFLRSAENSSDKASTWDTAREVVLNCEKNGEQYDYICILQPTSPLRTADDIKRALDIMRKRNADSVVSVCELDHAINICNVLGKNLSLNGFYDSNKSGRRQDSEQYYRLNGAIYIQNKKALLDKENLYGEKSYAYIMGKLNSIDIDDEIDFIEAEAVMSYVCCTPAKK